ncbi:MarR family transcriptional regulator [Sphingobium sp. 3R8]|uniref:MarR family winged helix-turn-helix transcriptional regulator n=1 Tax=Sphingobium sp. 3R8 TaxID=2874921 RepID=UPI001CCA9580|nr:MarR family transcriptional regulator [Sphingobium sp. 3R8]MBZ9649787.1 MarR family transcriptional regulator [Sphingobium sp. 3R8]
MSNRVPAAHLTSHLGYWLRFVSNHVSHAFARKLEAEGVTVAEWAMLRELYDVQAHGPSRLAEKMGLSRGAISKLADRLIAKRLVARTDRDDDARAHMLALTAAGQEIVPRLAALADINDAEFFDHLTPEDRTTVGRVLKTIVERRGLKAIPLS